MSTISHVRTLEVGAALLRDLEETLTGLVLEPDARVSTDEISAYQSALTTFEELARCGRRMSVESAITGAPGSFEGDDAQRVRTRYAKVKHQIRVLQALYGPQPG